MSLDKAIASGKEHRKQYRKPKLISSRCRNHGDCPTCFRNRTLDRYEYNSRRDIIEYRKSKEERH